MTAVIEGLGAVTVHVRELGTARRYDREVLGVPEAGFTEATGHTAVAEPDGNEFIRSTGRTAPARS